MVLMWSLVTTSAVGAGLLAEALLGSGVMTPAMAVHGSLMIWAWGILLPLGAVVARYFKVTPGQDFPAELDNPFWWNWHRRLQYGGVTIATAALATILTETHGRFDTLHAWCGLTVLVFGWLQVVSTWFRGTKGGPTGTNAVSGDARTWRGDHYDMTPRRRLFEAWHKPMGWGVLVLAACTLLLGAHLSGAPAWLFGLLGLLQASFALATLDGHLRGRWVDTYLALWGPDPNHPGNRS
jgi:hypothetical protein